MTEQVDEPGVGDATLPADSGEDATLPADGSADDTVLASQEPPDDAPTSQSLTPEAEGRYLRAGGAGAEVGRGGIGRVLLATDRHLGREIAVKELLADVAQGADSEDEESSPLAPARSRFLREARITAQLEHPNIVPVYELGRRDDGTLYYTMKLVRGRTLAQALRDCRSLRERLDLLGHYTDLCHAIAYAHSRGVVHRDIKTANVMVGEFGETVVLDWGLAKARDEKDVRRGDLRRSLQLLADAGAGKTVDGSALGTPAYMAPEQAKGELEAIDERSDVWSLGAVLYEMLTGQPPFVGKTALSVIEKVRRGVVDPVREREPASPPELASIAEKALQRDKADRYASAKDLAVEVEAFSAGARVGAYDYSSWELVKRFVARNRGIAVVVGLLAVTLVVGSALVFGAYRRAEQANRVSQRLARKEARARLKAERARQKARLAATTAQRNLVKAYLSRAGRLLKAGDHLTARIYAAAALLTDPDNPRSPNHRRAARAGATTGYSANIATAQSVIYRAKHNGLLRLVRTDGTARPGSTHLACPPAADWYAEAGRKRKVILRKLSTGKVLRRLEVGAHGYKKLVASHDGRWLLVGLQDGSIQLWDTRTGRQVARAVAHKSRIHALALSADGRQAATGSEDGRVRLWSMPDLRPAAELSHKQRTTHAVAFSPDGRQLVAATVTGFTPKLLWWDLATRRQLPGRSGHRSVIWELAFTPDGQRLLTSSEDLTVRVWDTRARRPVDTLRFGAVITGLSPSPDGKRLLATTATGALLFWGLPQSRLVAAAMRRPDRRRTAVLCARGTLAVAGGGLRPTYVWRLSAAPPVVRIPVRDRQVFWVQSIRGTDLVFTQDTLNRAATWNLKTKRKLVEKEIPLKIFRGLAVNASGRVLALILGDQLVLSRMATLQWETVSGFDTRGIQALALSSNARRLATAHAGGIVRIFELKGAQRVQTLRGGKGRYISLVFSPDDKRLVVVKRRRKKKLLELWDLERGRLLKELPLAGGGEDPQFVRTNHQLVLTGADQRIDLLSLPSGRVQQSFHVDGQVFFHKVSPDGRRLLATTVDRQLYLWATDSGRLLLRMQLATAVYHPDFYDQGRSIALATPEGLAVYPIEPDLWKQDPRQLLREAEQAAGISLKELEGPAQSKTGGTRK